MKMKVLLLCTLLLAILSCSPDLGLGAKPYVAIRNLATKTPAVVVNGMAGHGIANPRVLFSSQKPAQYVFSSWNQFCGIGKDLEVGCWSKNWLDTTRSWSNILTEKLLIVWDSTEILALDKSTFDTLYQAPFVESALWVDTLYTVRFFPVQSAQVVNAKQLIIATDHQLYLMGPTGETELLHEFQTPVTSVLWERAQGEWCVLNNASQTSGAVDSLACIRDGVLSIYPTDLVLGGVHYTNGFTPTLWAGKYLWILCNNDVQRGCHVDATPDGIAWTKVEKTELSIWGSPGFTTIPLESKILLANTSYKEPYDYRESYYNFEWYAVDRNGVVIDNSTISWKMDAFYEIKGWQTSAGNIAVSFIGSQTVNVYLFNQKGDLVK